MASPQEDDPFADAPEDGAAAAPDDEAEEDPFANEDSDDGGPFSDDEDRDDPDEDDDDGKRKAAGKKASKAKRQKITGQSFIADVEEVNYDDEDDDDQEVTADELLRFEREALAQRERRQQELAARQKELEDFQLDEDEEFDHRTFENRRTEREVSRAVQELEAREKNRATTDYGYGDAGGSMMDETEFDEQRLLPQWSDPNMWMIQCLPGMEQAVCLQLMRKYFASLRTSKPLEIKSVVANPAPRGGSKGRSYVFIEAFKLNHVQEAIKGIENLKWGQWKQDMVKIEDRPNLMRVVKPNRPVKKNDWVRLSSKGDYEGDVARVTEVRESEGMLSLQVIPRIDYAKFAPQAEGGRRKRKRVRAPQRLFSEQAAADVDADVEHDEYEGLIKFDKKTFDAAGFLVMNVRIAQVDTLDVRPSLAELRIFEDAAGAVQENDDSATARNPFKKGDKVEVKEGELQNLIGTVLSVEGRQVTIQPHHEDLHDPLPFMQHELQKAFKSSDHVKVTGGTFTGETGLVVKIDNDVIYIVSDHSMKEIKVKAKDVQLANEVSSGLDSLGQFELHELVQLDFRNVACIVRIDRDILVVLDQDGNDRQVKPISVQAMKRSRPGTAIDRERNEVRRDFQVKVIEGPYKGRSGKVLHVHRSNLFIFNREIAENNGVFVTRARNCKAAGVGGQAARLGGPSGASVAVPSSPHIHGGGGRGGGSEGRGGRGGGRGGRGGRGSRRNDMVGKTVRIIKGPLKGSMGTVKDATETTAKIELQARAKTKIVALNAISVINSETAKPGYYPKGSMQFAGAATPRYGAQTPQYGSMTPQHSGARTPRYGGATPGAGDATPSRGDATPSSSGGAWDPQLPNTPGAFAAETPGGWDGGTTPGEWPDTNSGTPAETPYGSDAYTPGAATTPGTPYDFTSTPSGAYGGTPDVGTPSDAYNYAGTPSDAMTPAAAYTPGTPSGVYTPGTPSETPYGSVSADTWHAPGVCVQTVDGPEGVILEVTDDHECRVRLTTGEETVFQKPSLAIVHPSKRDETVKVVGGAFRDQIGTVLGIEDGEIIVQLPGAENLLQILEKELLAKYEAVD